MHEDLSDQRTEYADTPLDASTAGADPMGLFATWFDDAIDRAVVAEPNAMALATATAGGVPSVRMVLLKQVDPRRAAFVAYTNLEGRKAREATATGHASLCWWWPGDPARQVRAGGRVEPVARTEAAAYFAFRPLAARIGAAASRQSRAIGSRAELDARITEVAASGAPELPAAWGGLRLVADELEFWQGRAGRVHDRITFLRLDEQGEPLASAAVDAAGGLDQVRATGEVVVDPHGASWLRVRLEP